MYVWYIAQFLKNQKKGLKASPWWLRTGQNENGAESPEAEGKGEAGCEVLTNREMPIKNLGRDLPPTLLCVSPELSAFQNLPFPHLGGAVLPAHHQLRQLWASAHTIHCDSVQLIRVFLVVWPQQLITGISRCRKLAPIRAIPALRLEQPGKKWFYYMWMDARSAQAPWKSAWK